MTEPALTGDLIDALGVKFTQHEGDLISDAVLVTKVIEADGSVRISVAWSDGMDFVTRRGLLEHACDQERSGDWDSDEGE